MDNFSLLNKFEVLICGFLLLKLRKEQSHVQLFARSAIRRILIPQSMMGALIQLLIAKLVLTLPIGTP